MIDCLNHIESLNLNEVVNVYIKAGTYDILEELGGTDFLSSLTPDSSISDIQPWLYNVNIKGLGNVKLVYKPSLALASQYPLAASLISPINVKGNVNIENIEIECQYCRYAIHDETSGNPKYNNTYHNYKNIKASHLGKLSSAIGGQAFGGGFDNGQSYNFENCYFKSISDNALSLHNRESNGANVNITNSIFITETSPSIRFGNVGTQGKTIINLSNSHLNNGLLINAESSAIPSSNAYAIYSLNCNDFNINISKNLGVNPYDPIVF